MPEIDKKYDLWGVHGAETFRDLDLGMKLVMQDDSLVEIVGNPHDGAVMVVKVLESEENPSSVGEEQTIFFAEVKGVATQV
jgi:hypothetical protein